MAGRAPGPHNAGVHVEIPTVAALAFVLASCDATPSREGNALVEGDLGVLEFELVSDRVAEGPNDFRLKVIGLEGRTPALSIRTLMPAMGHATDTAEVMETAPGEFALEGVVFDMPGAWAIRVRVAETGASETLDEAEFTLDVP
jgi:hypothetical protein